MHGAAQGGRRAVDPMIQISSKWSPIDPRGRLELPTSRSRAMRLREQRRCLFRFGIGSNRLWFGRVFRRQSFTGEAESPQPGGLFGTFLLDFFLLLERLVGFPLAGGELHFRLRSRQFHECESPFAFFVGLAQQRRAKFIGGGDRFAIARLIVNESRPSRGRAHCHWARLMAGATSYISHV